MNDLEALRDLEALALDLGIGVGNLGVLLGERRGGYERKCERNEKAHEGIQ